jgi:hypothetical protein
MPRLVSLTLLSVLVLPAGGLLYTVLVAAGYRWYGWTADLAVWLGAGAVTLAFVIGWWLLLWGRSVTWSSRMIVRSLIVTGLSLLVGLAAGGLSALVDIDITFSLFVGTTAAIVAWLVFACIIWGQAGASAPACPNETLVICPRCGYALNGLREARCPECGEAYTLDELMRAQPAFQQPRDLSSA